MQRKLWLGKQLIWYIFNAPQTCKEALNMQNNFQTALCKKKGESLPWMAQQVLHFWMRPQTNGESLITLIWLNESFYRQLNCKCISHSLILLSLAEQERQHNGRKLLLMLQTWLAENVDCGQRGDVFVRTQWRQELHPMISWQKVIISIALFCIPLPLQQSFVTLR